MALPLVMHVLLVVAAAGDVERGRHLIQQAECNRCHDIADVAAAPRERSCVACHRWIMGTAASSTAVIEARETFPLWDRHVERVGKGHYTAGVPSLVSIGQRLRPEWLKTYLQNPYDVRPNLSESMVRTRFSDSQLDDLVAFLTRDAGKITAGAVPQPDATQVAKGEQLFETQGCAACHLFGNRVFPSAGKTQFDMQRQGPRALAPDLRHARDRVRPEVIEQWIANPASIKPDTPMPMMPLRPGDAAALAAFILYASPGQPAAVAPVVANVTAPPKHVTWKDVDERVFSRVCIHCHMDPLSNDGDGGPGNTGGLGFQPIGLSFGSYREIEKGSIGPDGKRRSIFRKGDSGEAVLLERLRQRHVENTRDRVLPGQDALDDRRAREPAEPAGMPMGLPALTASEMVLVEAWVKAGHPGPKGRHQGMSAYYGLDGR